MPFRKVFDLALERPPSRHDDADADRSLRSHQHQLHRTRPRPKPKVQLLGVRGIPGNTINHPCSFFVPDHTPRVLRRARRHGVRRRLRPRALGAGRAQRLPRRSAWSSRISPCSTSADPSTPCAFARSIPASPSTRSKRRPASRSRSRRDVDETPRADDRAAPPHPHRSRPARPAGQRLRVDRLEGGTCRVRAHQRRQPRRRGAARPSAGERARQRRLASPRGDHRRAGIRRRA